MLQEVPRARPWHYRGDLASEFEGNLAFEGADFPALLTALRLGQARGKAVGCGSPSLSRIEQVLLMSRTVNVSSGCPIRPIILSPPSSVNKSELTIRPDAEHAVQCKKMQRKSMQ